MNLDGTHVMVDLETLGTGSNAVIISIGAVEFTVAGGAGRDFYMNVDPQSCVDAGLKIDPDTVMWWMKQSDEARRVFSQDVSNPLSRALLYFSDWFPQGACLWGNGATFDNVILSNAYKAVGLKQPWSYRADRCYRTLKNLYPQVLPDDLGGVAHNALADARYQAAHLIKIAGAV